MCNAGNVHCLACNKAFKEHTTLAQHLKDKHQGQNAAEPAARANLTLGDIMAQAQAKRAALGAKTAAAAARHQKQYSAFTPGDSKGMREYLKASQVSADQRAVKHWPKRIVRKLLSDCLTVIRGLDRAVLLLIRKGSPRRLT